MKVLATSFKSDKYSQAKGLQCRSVAQDSDKVKSFHLSDGSLLRNLLFQGKNYHLIQLTEIGKKLKKKDSHFFMDLGQHFTVFENVDFKTLLEEKDSHFFINLGPHFHKGDILI